MGTKVNGFSVLEVDNPFNELPFQKIRKFQRDFIENIEKSDVIFLSAPTGAGKTLCFEYLCKKNPPVLLVYPTTALMADQERQLKCHGVNSFILDSSSLGDIRGYSRSRELMAFFQRYDVIITNPDILSAVLHHVYVNPEEDLLRIFSYFHYIIYDEFHIYRELELSDLLLQLALFLGSSKAKVILSSATPSFEFISVLQDMAPTCKIKIMEERGIEKGAIVRYDTKICVTNEKFKANVNIIIKSCIEKKLKTLVICNSNKFARELYNSLVSEGYGEFITKDTGDETRGTIKADLTRLVIISTSKSEIGINYPLDVIIMDIAPDLQSFIQRFGRVSRQKEGTAFIFVKRVFNLDQQIGYLEFIETIRDYFLERKLSERTLRFLLEFRANLVLGTYRKHFDFLNQIFFAINWKKYYAFLKEIDSAKGKLSACGITSNKELDSLMTFLEDYKAGLSLLRGQSVSAKIRYQRGEDWTFTSYDLLHSLNNYDVAINQNYIELLAPSELNMVHSLIYQKVPYDFYKFTEQLKQEILEKWRRIENLGLLNKNHRWLLQELLSIDLKRIIVPEIVMLKDGTKVALENYG